jgi:hypothetical protein
MDSYDGPAGRYPNMATIDLVTFRRHPSFWLFRR